jgi:carboxyl-terminal processing protease
MPSRPRNPLPVAGSILIGIIAFGFVLGASLGKESIYTYLKVFAEAYTLVRSSYVDPVDDDAILDGAYRGMVGGLDLFSGYVSRDEFQSLKGNPLGGEADAGLEVLRVPGGAVVASVRPASEADRAGLRPGDQVWTVEGVAARTMSLLQLRRALRGAEESVLRMLVYHPETRKREDIRLRRTTPAGKPYEARVLDGGLGYLRILDMKRATSALLRPALGSLRQKGATSLLLDLRGCARGEVEDAVRLAGLFVPAGPIVTVQHRDPARTRTEELAKGRKSASWSLPVAVLGNSASAGGAEVLAAALRARLKAPLLGETTYGLGSTQELVPLPAGDGLVLSTAKLLSPDGESWNETGLKPDKEIPSTIEERTGQTPDTQLQKAIEHILGTAARAA